jgi:indole-3-acetate monooxygenase
MVAGYDFHANQTADPVAAARKLAPLILAARGKTEEDRRVPREISDALAASDLLQMYLPRSMGGPEFPPLTAFRAIEELSRVDGSVGWCAMIATDLSLFMGWLPADVGRDFCGKPADLRVAGSLRPQGQARPVEGGYRVSGHWNFASGIDHANWLYCPTVVMERDKPQLTATGAPKVRAMWVPRGEAAIVDTWSVVGMRGTGSQDFVIEDIFVPTAHTCFLGEPSLEAGPLYRPRMILVTAWSATIGNALGIARGAIDAFIDLAGRESSTSSTALLRDRPFVQTRVAQAEAILNSARAYVVESIGAAWQAACADSPDLSSAIAQARLAIVHGMHEAVRAVIWFFMPLEQMRSTTGTTWRDVFETSTSLFNMELRFRDTTKPPARH